MNLKDALHEAIHQGPFQREQFRTLIKNSYDQYFGDYVQKWDIAELMQVVTDSNLEEDLAHLLE
jgi:hypothetical protein